MGNISFISQVVIELMRKWMTESLSKYEMSNEDLKELGMQEGIFNSLFKSAMMKVAIVKERAS